MGLEVRLVVLLCLWWASQTEGVSISMGWILVPPSEFMSVWPQRSRIPNESVYAGLLCRYVENRQGRESGIPRQRKPERERRRERREEGFLLGAADAGCLLVSWSILPFAFVSCVFLFFFAFPYLSESLHLDLSLHVGIQVPFSRQIGLRSSEFINPHEQGRGEHNGKDVLRGHNERKDERSLKQAREHMNLVHLRPFPLHPLAHSLTS